MSNTAAPRCPLCDRPLGAPSVALTGGGRAHLACAEYQAARAWRRRRRTALGHALLAALALVGLGVAQGLSVGLLIVALAWATLYVRLHRRVLYYLQRDLRRALRRR